MHCIIMMNTTMVKVYNFHTKCPTFISCHTHLALDHTHFQGVQVNATKKSWVSR